MNQADIDWAEGDCEKYRRGLSRRVPFTVDELPYTNSPPPYPVLPGQFLEWHYRDHLSGNIYETFRYFSVRVSHCLVWVMIGRKKNPMSSCFPL